jgi:tetratricopeptide (TPR) repeat protein
MTKLKTYCAVISLGLLTACGSSPRQAPVDDLTNPVGPPPDARIAPMQPSPSRSVETYPLADSADGAVPPGSSAAPRGQAQPANPAVVALLNDANQALQSDRPDRAAASIERALAIEPRNAWLWHRLANARLRQDDLGQAAALAAKSNSLATADRRLQSDNWRIIAEVHRRRGELTAAGSAERKAAELSARAP